MISVKNVIEKPHAILQSDGYKLHNMLIEALNENQKVEISFEGISHCTTSFLNASFGKVWMNKSDFSESFSFKDLTPLLQSKIDLVKENALDKEKRENKDHILRTHLEEA